MGSTEEYPSALKLPFIDLSKPGLQPATPEWESLKSQVCGALKEFGCFEASINHIPADVLSSIFASLEELFDLPLETKLRNVSTKPYYGYVGQYPHVPLYESLGIEDPHLLSNVQNFTNTLWPEGNPSFSKIIHHYSQQLLELENVMRRMIVERFGLDKYMDEHINSTEYLLRVMKYKGPQTTEQALGISPHTDKNLVSILYQDKVEGLEVQMKDGRWIKSSPNSFIVMIGDSLHAWLNGGLHSAFHRVMMCGDEARYSMALFSLPKAGYIVKAPEEMVDQEHPLLFKPFDNVEYMSFVYSEAGQATLYPLRAYCGI